MPPTCPEPSIVLHATTIRFGDSAVLIQGPSGSGKSSLALRLMALGAALIADDSTVLRRDARQLIASAPDTLPHAIEARGIGLLAAQLSAPAPLRLVVDLSRTECCRLPPARHCDILGQKVALIHKIEGVHFPEAILQYVKGGGLLRHDR